MKNNQNFNAGLCSEVTNIWNALFEFWTYKMTDQRVFLLNTMDKGQWIQLNDITRRFINMEPKKLIVLHFP
jgi:hypothetical protein